MASWFKLISTGQSGLEGLQWMAPVFLCKCTAGRALHGVCSVAAGAASVDVVGATAVGSLSAWVVGADMDAAAGATSPMLDVSGLTASG